MKFQVLESFRDKVSERLPRYCYGGLLPNIKIVIPHIETLHSIYIYMGTWDREGLGFGLDMCMRVRIYVGRGLRGQWESRW